jgi:oligoribonuclease
VRVRLPPPVFARTLDILTAPQALKDKDAYLIWMDLEMTGLDPDAERIIEIATIITDGRLNIIAEGPELVIHQSDELLGAMDDWNRTHHGGSGLTERVKRSKVTEEMAEEETLSFIGRYCEPRNIPLAGNSIHQDRRFLTRYMPRLHDYAHYRNVDVSTIKELAKRWRPSVVQKAPRKQGAHRALEDIKESINELRYYRRQFFDLEG